MATRLVRDGKLSIVDGAGETIFSISEQFEEPRVTLHVSGKITLEAAHDFEDELMSLMTFCSNILIDFAGTSYISSEAMQSLLQAQKTIDTRVGASLVLCGIEGALLTQFRESGFDALFVIEEGM